MSRSLFSPSWHSVANLKPRLIPQARLHRHVYRGQVWYVVQDPSGGRYHRLSSAAQALAARMDGRRTVQQLWEEANTGGAGDACTQNELVDLLVQLHGADLLQTDITPDSAALLARYRKKRRETFKQWLMSPTSLKLPLLNPGPFIDRWAPSLAWCFGPLGAMLWLAVVIPATILAVRHWSPLTHNLSDQVLSSGNLLVMALVFPVVKLLHELGHAFATRVWGGTVHEMGLMLLVFAPFPYVDASAAAAFPSKYRRAVVGAAGMLVEVFLASLAMYVWLLSEPGPARAVAYNVMLIAGISTLIVNGNPLLRYDAYYILCDLIEIPNLAQRGQQYLTWLWDRRVYGVHDQPPPHTAPGEKPWLVLYTPLAWCYRTAVTLSIMLFVAGQFFIIGILLALWSLITQFGMPLYKGWKHLKSGASLQQRRDVAGRRTLGLIAVVLLLLFALPAPLRTTTEGVIWLPDQAILHAGGNGFFQRWLVQPGQRVKQGDALYVMTDRELLAELQVVRARAAEAEAQYRAQQFTEPAKARIALAQWRQELEVLQRTEQKARRLTGFAESDGILVAATPQDMPDRFYKQGALIGYILDARQLKVRAVVEQDNIDLVRTRLRQVELRLAESLARRQAARTLQEIPGGVNQLPSPALGLNGGGLVPTLPGDSDGLKTLEKVFLLDLAPLHHPLPAAFGERVYIRFDHGYEPVGLQALRRMRQLFLSHFNV